MNFPFRLFTEKTNDKIFHDFIRPFQLVPGVQKGYRKSKNIENIENLLRKSRSNFKTEISK